MSGFLENGIIPEEANPIELDVIKKSDRFIFPGMVAEMESPEVIGIKVTEISDFATESPSRNESGNIA